MKKKSLLMLLLSMLIISSMLLGACTPKATEAPAAAEEEVMAEEEEVVVEEEEEAVVEEEEEVVVEEEEVMEPTRLTIVEGNPYTSLDPFTNAWHATPTYAVFATLVALSGDLKEYQPAMAASWEFSEDNLSMTMVLRDDITFTDGTPMNAEAVVWNMDKYLDEDLASPGGGDLRQAVESVEVVDEYTIKFNLYAPWAPLLNQLSGQEIASPTAYEELGSDAYAQELISAGMFIVQEVVPDVSILYVKNPDYNWGPAWCDNQGAMPFDELLIKYIADEAVVYAALETGEIQIAPVPPQYMENALANPDIEVVTAVSTTTGYFGMNNTFAPFDNIEVRKAIAYALDRQEVVDIAFDGTGAVPTYQPLAMGNQGHNPEFEAYGMATSDDLDLAMQMLEDLGYTDSDGDGIRETPEGVPMEYKLQFITDPTTQRIAETLQNQLLKIGIATNLTPVDGTVMRETTAAGEHEMFTWMYGMLDPMITTYIFHSARIGASNRNHVNSPELDTLLDIQDSALDPAARQAAVDDVTTYLIDNRHHVPLFTFMSFVGYRSDLVEPKLDILGATWFCDTVVK